MRIVSDYLSLSGEDSFYKPVYEKGPNEHKNSQILGDAEHDSYKNFSYANVEHYKADHTHLLIRCTSQSLFFL